MAGSSKPQAATGPDWAAIGAWIGEERERLGLTKTEAARRARVSNTTWRQIESGANGTPTDETLIRIARALRLDAGEMMSRAQRRYVNVPTVRELVPVGAPLDLLHVLESDGRLDGRSRRLLMELYDALAAR